MLKRLKIKNRIAGIEFVECGGIEPNPKIDSVRRGIELIRKNGCDLIIAIGGGSAMDVAKCIKLFAALDTDQLYLEQNFKEVLTLLTKRAIIRL